MANIIDNTDNSLVSAYLGDFDGYKSVPIYKQTNSENIRTLLTDSKCKDKTIIYFGSQFDTSANKVSYLVFVSKQNYS
ncbi:MAG: hypothetical protein GY830_03560 [Bacteroidetes bacterium]|nr:hypothetical protein [Bacteroidota bacterium]